MKMPIAIKSIESNKQFEIRLESFFFKRLQTITHKLQQALNRHLKCLSPLRETTLQMNLYLQKLRNLQRLFVFMCIFYWFDTFSTDDIYFT